jgi:HAE1 family hydrophobic/amphiphilic exporter-1
VELPTRIGVVGEAHLPLAEAIERVLKSDPELRISRINKEEAGFNIKAALGAYDPVLGVKAYRTRAITPVASILGGAASGKLTQNELNLTPQVQGLTPWGGSYNFQFSNSRQQTDNLFATLNPQYPSTATLNLTQPLWRGLRFDPYRERVAVARVNQRLSSEQLRQRVIERVTAAINAYWELA